MVIVRIATKDPKPSADFTTKELQPYQGINAQLPYITAYLKTTEIPSAFIIGDAKKYQFGYETYLNQPLEENSSYIVFLRFIESEVNALCNIIKPVMNQRSKNDK